MGLSGHNLIISQELYCILLTRLQSVGTVWQGERVSAPLGTSLKAGRWNYLKACSFSGSICTVKTLWASISPFIPPNSCPCPSRHSLQQRDPSAKPRNSKACIPRKS